MAAEFGVGLFSDALTWYEVAMVLLCATWLVARCVLLPWGGCGNNIPARLGGKAARCQC